MSDVSQLREQVERMQLVLQLQQLTDLAKPEPRAQLFEWGEVMFDPQAPFRGEELLGASRNTIHISRPHDRANGDFWPHWRTEQELAAIRGTGEWLATSDAAAVGALEALTSYVIGVGYQHTTTPRTPDDRRLATAAQAVLDEFYEREGWCGSLDAEVFQRLRSQGEAFLHVDNAGGGVCSLTVLEPSWVLAPPAGDETDLESAMGLPVGLNWSYGVATAPGRLGRPLAYYVQLQGTPETAVALDAEQVLHLRVNTPRNVKRGLSDFYAGREWFDGVRKLLRNTTSGAAIQASIALLRKWNDNVRPASIRSASDAAVDFVAQMPASGAGSQSVNAERYYPGKVVDVKGGDVVPGPMGGSAAGVYLQVLQAGLRHAALRWNMPEYMITGDASNANYASTLVAESPFVKFCERQQAVQVQAETRISRMVLRAACLAGRLEASEDELLARIKLDTEPPQVATRDLLAEHQRHAGQYNAGLLSKATWAAAEGIDYDEEQRRRVEEPQPAARSQLSALTGALGEARTLEEAAASWREWN